MATKEEKRQEAIGAIQKLIAKAEEVVEASKEGGVAYKEFHSLSQEMYEKGLSSYNMMLRVIKTDSAEILEEWKVSNKELKILNDRVAHSQIQLGRLDYMFGKLLRELDELALEGRDISKDYFDNYTDLSVR